MSIIKHDYEKSAGLLTEIEVHKGQREMLDRYQTISIEDFVNEYTGNFHGMEFVHCCASFTGRLKILDVGAGAGRTSLYLALQGHDVTAIEPSPDLCSVMELLSRKANVDIAIHECSVESVDFRDDFDVCIFNASFHHCEDPAAAMGNCYRSLKENGRIFLMNEPVLRFYKSKSAYYKKLKNAPGKLQHWGGNEHVYRNHEYRSFLKRAGFRPLRRKVPVFYSHPKSLLDFNLHYKGIDGYEYPFSNIALRALWYFLLNAALKNRLVAAIAEELSLICLTFIGIKPAKGQTAAE